MECQADQLLVFMDFEVCLVDLAMADGIRWWLIRHGANGEGAVAGMIVYMGFPFCFLRCVELYCTHSLPYLSGPIDLDVSM